MAILKAPIKNVECIGPNDGSYVYDVSMQGNLPYFFGNNILLHNSCYFSAKKFLEQTEEGREILQDRNKIIKYYDNIAEEVNKSFAEFMNISFNTGLEKGGIIQAGREVVASKGLFIKKKRYTLMVYDKDGFRYDVDGKPGKIKSMGLEVKRSDTSKIVQKFLEKVIEKLLTNVPKLDITKFIMQYREEFKNLHPWEAGSPKKVNNLVKYSEQLKKASNGTFDKKRVNLPENVKASLNWNKLREENNDNDSLSIQEGQKIIICKLLPNRMNMDCIAYPVDEKHLPKWFKELPFDSETMLQVSIDKKVENLLGVLNWDLSTSQEDFANPFDFV